MRHFTKQIFIVFVLIGLLPAWPAHAIMMTPDQYYPCAASCTSDKCVQDCLVEMAVRESSCEPEVFFHADSGIFCGRECPADRVTCSRGDSLGRFVWDKSFTEDLERVEYRYDPGSKTFQNFFLTRKDGSREEAFVTFDPQENAYLFCSAAEESLCERFDFEPKTGLFRSVRRHGGKRNATQTYRILVVPIRWEGYLPNITLAEVNDFMENEFVPHVEDSSCGAMEVEYEVIDWLELNPETSEFEDVMDAAAAAPGVDLLDFNGILEMYSSVGDPATPLLAPGCCTSWVFTYSTEDGTGTFGFMEISSDSVSNLNVGRLYYQFVRAQGVIHGESTLECAASVEDCGDPDTSLCFEEEGDLWEGMGTEVRSPDLLYSAAVREKLGWGYVYDLTNPYTGGGSFALSSLESCDTAAGISVHLDESHEYILDYSETINDDPFVADYDPAPDALFGYTEGAINSYRPLSQFNEMSKIGVRQVVDVTNKALLLDMAPDSLGLDSLDALLPVGSSYERCAGTPNESGIFIYPYYSLGNKIKIYIGPGDSGELPSISLNSMDTMTEVTLPPVCIPMFDASPLVTIVADITDDTAVMRADLRRVETDDDGILNVVGELGEGVRMLTGDEFVWLVSPFDLADGENRLQIVARDIFFYSDVFELPSPIQVERYRPEFVAIAAIPETVVGDTTMWVAVQLEENPFLDRVELYREPVCSDSFCVDSSDPEFVDEMWTLGSGYYYLVLSGATDLGLGDFALFARAYDFCGDMAESDPVTVHVMESSP